MSRVAKHGNRSVSSRCGSADVFEALGVGITAPPEVVERSLDEAGVAFLFAPSFHPAMKHAGADAQGTGPAHRVQPARPAHQSGRPARQIVGVPRPELTELVARALLMLGSERVWVVHGADGLDEISTTGYTKVSEGHDGTVRTFHVHPGDFGLKKATLPSLAGGDAAHNAKILVEMLRRTGGPGARHRAPQRRAPASSSPAAPQSVREGIAAAAAAVDGGNAPARARGAGAGDHRGADGMSAGPATCSAPSSRPRARASRHAASRVPAGRRSSAAHRARCRRPAASARRWLRPACA